MEHWPLRRIPRQSRSEATIEFVLEAARRVVDDVGVGRTTMTRIAHVAGVSVGSLYQYFRDKQAMLEALTEREVQRVDAEVPALDLLRPNLHADLRSMIGAIARGYGGSRRLVELLLDARRPLLSAATLARRQARLRALIVRHRGWSPDLELKAVVAAHFVEGLVLCTLTNEGPTPDAEQVLAEAADLLDRYLVASEGDLPSRPRSARPAAARRWLGRRRR